MRKNSLTRIGSIAILSVFATIGLIKTVFANDITVSEASGETYSGCSTKRLKSERQSYDWAKENTETGDCCYGYDMLDPDTGEAITTSCFHWIESDGATFGAALDNMNNDGWTRSTYSATAAATCRADDKVVWVGREFDAGKVFANHPPRGGGYSNKTNSKSSLSREAQDLIDAGVAELGTTEDALGFVCQSMMTEQVGNIEPEDVGLETCGLNSSLYAGKRLGNSGSVSLIYRNGAIKEKTTTSGKPEEQGYDTLSDIVVYAKPGDKIQFENQYCYGAQGVKGSTPTGQTAKITTAQNNYHGSGTKLTDQSAWNSWRNWTENYSQSSSDIQDGKTKTSPDTTIRQEDAGTYVKSAFEFNSVRSWINTKTSLAARNSTDTQNAAGFPWRCSTDGTFSASSTSDISNWTQAVNNSNDYSYTTPGSANSWYYGSFTWGCKSSKREFVDGATGEVWKWKKTSDTLDTMVHGSSDISYSVSSTTPYDINTSMTAVIPYNFDTKVTAFIGSEGGSSSVDAGESTNLNFKVGILRRKNPDVDGDNIYSTSTPSYTKIQMVSFIIPADADIANQTTAIENANKLEGGFESASTYSDVCAYFESKGLDAGSSYTGGINCQSVTADNTYSDSRATIDGSISAASDASGISEVTRSYNDAPVPDRPGAKFCIAVGVYPSDSHNNPANDDSTYSDITAGKALGTGVNKLDTNYNGQHGQGTTNSTSPNWRISGAICSTIAKKANSQVWGSVYTNGSISTNISKKIHAATNPGTYGSWADTSIIAKGNISLMSSAAALGYTNILSYPGGNGGTNAVNFCENIPSTGTGGNWKPPLSLTVLTVGRVNSDTGADNCDNDKLTLASSGDSSLVNVTDKTGGYIGALRDRYTDANPSNTKGDLTIKSWDSNGNSHSALKLSHELRKYEYETGKSIETRIINSTGTVTIDSLTIPKDYTLIINAKSIIIKGNICYEDGTCKTPGSGTILKDRNSTTFNTIASLPQAIFFASDEIFIRKEVSQVDAWLVGEGYVQTCAFDTATGDAPTSPIADSDGVTHNISTEKAEDCARLLVINGPVFTSSVKLRRTGGAFSNDPAEGGVKNTTTKGIEHALDYDGSITPAEILNLRPDAYLWSYYQAQQNTQAINSYTRELAPRL